MRQASFRKKGGRKVGSAIGGLDLLILVALPYVSAALAIMGFVQLYRESRSCVEACSGDSLEPLGRSRALAPLRYGLAVVLLAHLAGLLLPGLMMSWNSSSVRLYVLEIALVSCGFVALTGSAVGVSRRFGKPLFGAWGGIREYVAFLLLVSQVVTGLLVALFCRWGTGWFAAAATPYLQSLLFFSPDISTVVGAPLLIKIHVANAFLLIGMLPYSRLYRLLADPLVVLFREVVLRRLGRKGAD